jgi:hypothetical protein
MPARIGIGSYLCYKLEPVDFLIFCGKFFCTGFDCAAMVYAKKVYKKYTKVAQPDIGIEDGRTS